MSKRLSVILVSVILCAPGLQGQGLAAGPAYQQILMNNPGLSGASGDGIMRLSYLNHFPGNSFDLHSFYLSYDSYFPQLHGGVSAVLTDDYLGGIINDTRGGFSYAYFLQAGKDIFIHAGLSASVFHRGYNFGSAVLPDQIDPLAGAVLPSSEVLGDRGRTLLDLGAGLVVCSGRFSAGFSVSHLTAPEIYTSAAGTGRLSRRFDLHLAYDPGTAEGKSLKLLPLFAGYLQGPYASAGLGASLETARLAINSMVFGDREKNVNIQTGFSFFYSAISVFYNYRLNAVRGNSLLPLSLLHEVGLAVHLNNVEKRKEFKTINFPKL